jgi:hypothetical protein
MIRKFLDRPFHHLRPHSAASTSISQSVVFLPSDLIIVERENAEEHDDDTEDDSAGDEDKNMDQNLMRQTGQTEDNNVDSEVYPHTSTLNL